MTSMIFCHLSRKQLMSKTSLKKRVYWTTGALFLVTFSALWYVTDYYLEMGTNQALESLKSKGMRVTFDTPVLTGFSWRSLGRYRHFERLCVEHNNMTLFIPLCTVQMGLVDLMRQRLSFQSRGTIRISIPKGTCTLERMKGAVHKTKDGWALQTHIFSGKILNQGQALLSLETLAIQSSHHHRKNTDSFYNVDLTSAVSFLSPLIPNKKTHGTITLQAQTEPKETRINHYHAAFSDISVSGQGQLQHASPNVRGVFDISLKGLDYNLILLFYTLSLRFGKTSELNSFLDRLAQKTLAQTEKFTLIIQPNHVYLKEFPFVRFDFPTTF